MAWRGGVSLAQATILAHRTMLGLPYCHTYGVATNLNLDLNLDPELPYYHTYGVAINLNLNLDPELPYYHTYGVAIILNLNLDLSDRREDS